MAGGPAASGADDGGHGVGSVTGDAAVTPQAASLAAMADLIAVMDRLRSPGGCPWDAQQTHASLVQYVIEEAYEVVEAIEDGDRPGLVEELGDVLLQVVFHARLAQEHPTDPFGMAEVAAGVAAKLRRRHPQVFGAEVTGAGSPGGPSQGADDGARGGGPEDLHGRWEQIKKAEKSRASVLDGIPPGLPALARAQKVLSRGRRAGLVDRGPEPDDGSSRRAGGEVSAEGVVGARLLEVVADAEARGVDAEGALRAAVRALEERLRGREATSDRDVD